jgi:hypothetical protein
MKLGMTFVWQSLQFLGVSFIDKAIPKRYRKDSMKLFGNKVKLE